MKMNKFSKQFCWEIFECFFFSKKKNDNNADLKLSFLQPLQVTILIIDQKQNLLNFMIDFDSKEINTQSIFLLIIFFSCNFVNF